MSEKTFKQWFSEHSREGITLLVFMSMFAQWVAACSGEEQPAISEVYSDNEAIGGTAIYAPTPEATATSEANNIQYPTEIYVSDRLDVCSMHQFGTAGALTPRIFTQCSVNPEVEDNRLIVTGNLIEISDLGYLSLTEDRGYSNPLEPQMMSVEQLREWVEMMDLDFTEKSDIQRVIDEAEQIDGEVMVIFKTIYNKSVDENNEERLVDMGLTVGFQPFGGNEVAVLEDRLDPVTKVDVLSGMQVASVDMVSSAIDLDQISLEVYPADWVESSGGKFVSPEFIDIQDEIAGFGTRFTLNGADGLIYDGETPIPGLTVSPDGAMTLTVNGETVTLDHSDVTFDDENGISIDGYELDENGEWVEVEPLIAPKVQEKFDMAGIDPEAMKNASMGEDGLHVSVGEGEGIDVTNEQLARAYAWEGKMVIQIPGGGLLVWNEQSASFEVKEYPTCKPADFQKCPIPLEEVQLHGMFAQSTLTEGLFDPDQLKIMNEYFKFFGAGGKTILIPDPTSAPNYTNPDTRPFIRDYATGIAEVDGQAYFEIQVPQYVEGVEPTEWPVMTGLHPQFMDLPGTWPVSADIFVKHMNIVPWRVDDESVAMATRFVNPATGENFTVSEVNKIIEEMAKGDFSHTNGLVLLFHVAKADEPVYK